MTTKPDPVQYLGSGTYWKKHLKKHGKDISTPWCQRFEDRDELVSYALQFSKENNIVESKEWANLIDEDGLHGFPTGQIRSDQHKENLSKANKGRKDTRTPEVKALAGKKASAKLRGKKKPAGFGDKVSKSHLGKSLSSKAKENMSASWTEERKAAQAIIQTKRNAARPILTCPHCGKQGVNGGIMRKFHFENCAVLFPPKEKKPRVVKEERQTEWIFLSPLGEKHVVQKLRAFCREHNLSSGTMSEVSLGNRPHHKGWTAAKS